MFALYTARTISLLLAFVVSTSCSFAIVGPGKEDAWQAQYSKGMMSLAKGHYKDAERSLLSCLSECKGNRAYFLLALAALEDLYDKVQNHAAEEEILLTYLGYLNASGQDQSVNVAGAYLRLGGLNALMNRYSKAEEYFELACPILKHLVGRSSIDLGIALNNVAWAERKQMKNADAETHYLESLNVIATATGQKSTLYGLTAISLAELYVSVHKNAQAVHWYERAVEALKASVAADHPALLSTMRRLESLKQDQRSRQALPLNS